MTGAAVASGKTVTLKPESGATVTINFSQGASQAINGGLIIGAYSAADANSLTSTTGFILDGSNNGTSSRDLTLATFWMALIPQNVKNMTTSIPAAAAPVAIM